MRVPRSLRTLSSLLANSLILGLLPLIMMPIAARYLPSNQLATFVQLWVGYNFISISLFGTLESMMPRLMRQGVKKPQLLALSSLGYLASALMVMGLLVSMGLANDLVLVAGLFATVLVYGVHALVRGTLMAHERWSLLAAATGSQALVTLTSLMLGLYLFGPRLAVFFVSLMLGYVAVVILYLARMPRTQEVASPQGDDRVASVGSYIRLALTSMIASLLPASPVLVAGRLGASSDELLFLATAPYLVRIAISVSNAITPWFLSVYQKHRYSPRWLLSAHLVTLILPASIAVVILAVGGQAILGAYLGREINYSTSAFLLILLAELIFGGAGAFRTFDLAIGVSKTQVYSWLAGLIVFTSFFIYLRDADVVMGLASALAGSACIVFAIQAVRVITFSKRGAA